MSAEYARQFVEVAARIGERLVETARTADGKLAWRTVKLDPTNDGSRPTVYVPASPSLYGGASGIALALAELAFRTKDDRMAQAALETLGLATESAAPSISFHTGNVGQAWACYRAAELLHAEELVAVAKRHLDLARQALPSDRALDVIGGSAGAIPALVAMARRWSDDGALDLAIRAGERIESAATRRRGGWSWLTSRDSVQDLCGYAHGVSGFVHAFLELYAATGDGRWRHAAQRGLEYERQHRIDGTGDWPDFRSSELGLLRVQPDGEALVRKRLLEPKPLAQGATPMRAWCHGAPGVAFVRARATALGLDVGSDLALAATAAVAACRFPVQSASLCHGLMGNADVLLHLPEDLRLRHLPTAVDSIQHAIELWGAGDRPWPSGFRGGPADPSLMLGDAGAIHVLLRFANPDIPSVCFVTAGSGVPMASPESLSAAMRTELRVLSPRLSALAARAPQVDALLDEAATVGAASDATAAALEHLRQRVSSHELPDDAAIAWRQDEAVLDVEAAFRNHLEQAAALAAAAVEAPFDADAVVGLGAGVVLIDGGAGMPALLVSRGARTALTMPLTALQERVLMECREPVSVRSILDTLRLEFDASEASDAALEEAVVHLLDTLRQQGIVRRAAEVPV